MGFRVVISIGLRVARLLNFAREDDESLRRGAYVMKRIASEQGQVVPGGWLQNTNVRGVDDLHRLNLIAITVLTRSEFDFVADPNIAKGTEKSVAMRGQSNVALVTRQGRSRKMTHGTL